MIDKGSAQGFDRKGSPQGFDDGDGRLTTVFVGIEKLTSPTNILAIVANHNLRAKLTGDKGLPTRVADKGFVQGFADEGVRRGFAIHEWGVLLAGSSDPEQIRALAADTMAAAGVGKLRKDAVRAIEVMVSWDLRYWERPEEVFEACALLMKWVASRFGVILSAALHTDESAPHVHIALLPLIDGHMVGSDAVGGPSNLKRLLASLGSEWAGLGMVPSGYSIDDPLTKLALSPGVGRDTSDEAEAARKPLSEPLCDSGQKEQTLSCGGSGGSPFRGGSGDAAEGAVLASLQRQADAIGGLVAMVRHQGDILASFTAGQIHAIATVTHNEGADFDTFDRDTLAEARAALARHAGNRHVSPLAAQEAARAGSGESAFRAVLTDRDAEDFERITLTEARLALANDAARKASDREAEAATELQATREELSEARSRLAAEVARRDAAETAMQAANSASPTEVLGAKLAGNLAGSGNEVAENALKLEAAMRGRGWMSHVDLSLWAPEGMRGLHNKAMFQAMGTLRAAGRAEEGFFTAGLSTPTRGFRLIGPEVDAADRAAAGEREAKADADVLVLLRQAGGWTNATALIERKIPGLIRAQLVRASLDRLTERGLAERKKGRQVNAFEYRILETA